MTVPERSDCLGCVYSEARIVRHRGLEYQFWCHHPDAWHQHGEDRVVGYDDARPDWCPVIGGDVTPTGGSH